MKRGRETYLAAACVIAIGVAVAACTAYGSAVRTEAGHVLVAQTLTDMESQVDELGDGDSFAAFVRGAQPAELSTLLYLESDVAPRFPAYTRQITAAMDEVYAAHELWAQAEEVTRGTGRTPEVDQRLESADAHLEEARMIAERIHPVELADAP